MPGEGDCGLLLEKKLKIFLKNYFYISSKNTKKLNLK
jgi:hypothetical protein